MPDQQPSPDPAIVIAATFTAEPVVPAMQFVLGEAGLTFDVRCAPYHQVFQQLLSPMSLLSTNSGGVNVMLIRMEDFVRELEDASVGAHTILRTANELADALRQQQQLAKIPTILAVFEPSPSANEDLRHCLEATTATFIEQARNIPGIQVLTPTEIGDGSVGERYDGLRDDLAHIPFTEEFYGSMALAIARKIHALKVPAHKVLVLDCDNTLWRGVVGEDGIEGITISEAFLAVQRFAIQEQEKGALICLVSKNAEEDVLGVLRERTDMLLKAEHIVAHRINWKPKPANISSLATELNLGLDSFVFLDDNPVECAQVRAALPQVVTLQLPPEDEIEHFLSHLWAFDKVAITSEDMRRTAMYRENAARQSLEESATDIGEFIESLGLIIDIAPPEEDEWTRVAQLTQRTNQFNFTTLRRTESEMRASQAAGSVVLRVTVQDRFGAYGLVGVVAANPRGDSLAVDILLLSCRVLGRGVEHAMLRRLGELAHEQGLAFVDLQYIKSTKNEPAYAFAESVAADFRATEQEHIRYRLPVAHVCGVAHRPGHDPEAVVRARKAEESKGAAKNPLTSVSSTANRSERYELLTRDLASGRAVINAIRARSLRRRTSPDSPEAPATELEQKLTNLWREILNIDQLGVEDDYFALGGTSLLAARMFAEVARRFGIKLRLTTILESPTVRALARHIAPQKNEHSGCLVELKRGISGNLFLIHDGDGETLLYLNLARHLPSELAVCGVEPRRLPRVPLGHTRIEDMAGFYVQEIRKQQPHGPYMLGGLCAGGVIAYEMAYQLKCAGESVKLVAILDAAAPRAHRRSGLVLRQRAKRWEQMVADLRQNKGALVTQGYALVKGAARKLLNVLVWEVSSRVKSLTGLVRFSLLHWRLSRGKPWPPFLADFNVRDIYDSAAAKYVPRTLIDAGVLLARARTGTANDTPYREIYADDTFGWKSLVPDITVVDVEGGHSSMLQEPFVESLASVLALKIVSESLHRSVRVSGRDTLQLAGTDHLLESATMADERR